MHTHTHAHTHARVHRTTRRALAGYNEILVSSVEWHHHLPRGVEAVLALGVALGGTADDERLARRVHTALLEYYAPLGAGRGTTASPAGPAARCPPPLLRFNGSHFEELEPERGLRPARL